MRTNTCMLCLLFNMIELLSCDRLILAFMWNYVVIHIPLIDVACFYDACISIVYGSFPLCGSELAEPINLPGFRGSEARFLTQCLWANHGLPLFSECEGTEGELGSRLVPHA